VPSHTWGRGRDTKSGQAIAKPNDKLKKEDDTAKLTRGTTRAVHQRNDGLKKQEKGAGTCRNAIEEEIRNFAHEKEGFPSGSPVTLKIRKQ